MRRPALVPLLVLVTAPLRPPLSFDSSSALLVRIADDGRLGRLLPLYFVLAAAACALVWRALRGDELRPLPRQVALPAAAFFAFACCSLLWADDVEAGTNLLLFFTLPFVALLATVARADFPPWAPRALAAAALALATLFAAVGLWQAATHELFFYAPNLAASNANTDYFRVTSLFGDPSLYGRHVVLGIGVALALLATRRWRVWPLIGLVAIMWAGLLFSYSQSSMVALLVITLLLAVATGDRRVRRAVALLTLAAALVGCGYLAVQVANGESLNRITSDRTNRVEDAVRVIEKHPLVGVGIGGQPRASRRLAGSERPTPNFVSHTTPLTVFAELGVIGLVLYAWLLAGGAWLIVQVWRRDETLGPRARDCLRRAVRARALLQRLPRGPAHVARDRDSGRLLLAAGGEAKAGAEGGDRVTQREGWILTGVLFVLVAITLPELGSDPWHFRPAHVDPQGPLAPLVRAAGEEWDVGIARAAAFGAALLCGAFARLPARTTAWQRSRAGPASRWCSPSACCSPRRPPSSSSACATPRPRGSSPTTRPTRRSWAASSCSTSTTRTATTTGVRGWSASTRATGACRSACASTRWR